MGGWQPPGMHALKKTHQEEEDEQQLRRRGEEEVGGRAVRPDGEEGDADEERGDEANDQPQECLLVVEEEHLPH